jgi:hypothetical protein
MSDRPPAGRTVIVRLTTKCLFQCAHCCFECGPKRDDVMSLDIARQVRTTFEGHVTWANVMGGEITLLPNYEELLAALHFTDMRVVTNGWWVESEKARNKFVSVVRSLVKSGPPVRFGISRDRFHPPGIGDAAMEWLKTQVDFDEDWGFTATKDPKEEERAIAPVGRAFHNDLGDPILRMMGAYCSAHRHRQSMTVLEDGAVTYCPFGAWPMGYLHWGFDELEEIRVRIDKVFKTSCVRCWQQWDWMGGKKRAYADLRKAEEERNSDLAAEAEPTSIAV